MTLGSLDTGQAWSQSSVGTGHDYDVVSDRAKLSSAATTTSGSTAAFVQTAHSEAANVASLACTFAAAPTAGNLLVLVVVSDYGLHAGGAPAGWTRDLTEETSWPSLVMFSRIAAGSGDTSVTVNMDFATGKIDMCLLEFSGNATASYVDKVVGATGTSGTSATAGPTATLSQANEIAVAAVGWTDVNTTSGWTNSFVERSDANVTAGFSLAVASRVVTATTALSTDVTGSAAAIPITAVVTYKANSGSSASVASYATFESGTPHALLKAVTPVAGNNHGLAFRFVDASNTFRFVQQKTAGRYVLSVVVAGTETDLGTIAAVPADGDVIAVEYVGTTIDCYVNGTKRLTVTNSSHGSATKAGITGVADTSARWDDLKLFVRTASAPSVTTPAAPSAPSATGGNTQAIVSWSTPNNGGSPITGYTVTASNGTVRSVGVVNTMTFTGLTNGTAYTFTVRASNVNGTGPASPPSNSVTPTGNTNAPSAPTNVTAVAGNGQATVSWSAPSNSGTSSIIDYTVTGTPGGTVTVTAGSPWWLPTVGASWQWQLTGTVDTSINADVYDIDGFDNAASVVTTLHNQGRHVIAYFSAGTYEDWRSDAGSFPGGVLGSNNGWPGEKWLDIRQINVLRPIMEARVAIAKTKGFNAIEWDNVDGYANSSGFALTGADQIAYNTMLAEIAHDAGMSVGLKNDLDQVAQLVSVFDFAVNEQCFEYDEADMLTPFIDAGKPVFNAEYNGSTSTFCPIATSLKFSSIFKNLDLDAYRVACPLPPTQPPPPAGGTTATVTGLTNGTAYTFTVRARNSSGSGPSSAPSAAVTPVGSGGGALIARIVSMGTRDQVVGYGSSGVPVYALNEAHPHGTPADYTQWVGGFADPPAPNNYAYAGAWFTLTHDDAYPTDFPGSSNSRLAIKLRAYELLGNGTWRQVADHGSYFDAQGWVETFQGNGSSGAVSSRLNTADGSYEIKPLLEGGQHRGVHGWTGTEPRTANHLGILAIGDIRVVKDNPAGTDDRATYARRYLCALGSDYWIAPGNTNQQAVFGKACFAPTNGEWRTITATNLTQSQLNAYPPPPSLWTVQG